jgi:glycosyltransferase involved in cell wall biosynthesis
MYKATQSVPTQAIRIAVDVPNNFSRSGSDAMNAVRDISVALLTGGSDRPYALGLAMALTASGVSLEFIGSDQLDGPEIRASPRMTFFNLRGDQRADATVMQKMARVLLYYVRLLRYALTAKPKVFHILWNNKFETFDRTVLMLFYKVLGKKVAFTAHNVNAGVRDATDSLLNRLTLKIQYRLADHIFVHTDKMKAELIEHFGVRGHTITVIPFGINNSIPQSDLTGAEARRRLGIGPTEPTILFFGNIEQYKGLEYLVAAYQRVARTQPDSRLIIAGRLAKGCERYLEDIQRTIERDASRERIIQRIEFIPDEQTEAYFKAADILVLPYTHVYQSGVLITGYNFGLPAVASDVGSFRDDIVEGQTGFLCRPCDSDDLARAIEAFFLSDLFITQDERRVAIREHANRRYSWDTVSRMTRTVYAQLLAK